MYYNNGYQSCYSSDGCKNLDTEAEVVIFNIIVIAQIVIEKQV